MGHSNSTLNTSHVDGLLFGILWKKAMSDAELSFLTTYPWVLWSNPDQIVDHSLAIPVQLDALIPVDSQGMITVDGIATIPVDSLGWGSRKALIPVDSIGWGVRKALIPVDSQGLNPFSLGHAWNVRRFFDASLVHEWDVTQTLFSASLQHNWNVKEAIFDSSLTHTWRVIPNLPATFSNDIQCPVADIDMTT